MSSKIEEKQKKLKDLGYFASQDLSKLVLLFEAAGKRAKRAYQHYYCKESQEQEKLF